MRLKLKILLLLFGSLLSLGGCGEGVSNSSEDNVVAEKKDTRTEAEKALDSAQGTWVTECMGFSNSSGSFFVGVSIKNKNYTTLYWEFSDNICTLSTQIVSKPDAGTFEVGDTVTMNDSGIAYELDLHSETNRTSKYTLFRLTKDSAGSYLFTDSYDFYDPGSVTRDGSIPSKRILTIDLTVKYIKQNSLP